MAFQANRNKMQAGIAILISERLQNKLIRQNKKEHYISIKEKNPPREKITIIDIHPDTLKLIE